MTIGFDNFKECVIYLRTSTEDQNPENQLKDCESIRPKDRTFDTFCDYEPIYETKSAWKDDYNRIGFSEILRRIKARKLKNLIVWDLDRIYRNRIKLKGFFELCRAYNIKVYSYRQSWLNDLNNIPAPWNEVVYDLLINIFGYISEDESKKKSERVKIAVRRKDSIAYSYKGNKWGRRSLSESKKREITNLYNQIPKKSMKMIAIELNLSVGVVHKYIAENKKRFRELEKL